MRLSRTNTFALFFISWQSYQTYIHLFKGFESEYNAHTMFVLYIHNDIQTG
jgi:hypothetical protein